MANESEWQELASQGQAVGALRAYCQTHGVGLAEARTAVERWRAVNCPPSPGFQRAFRVARRLTDALLEYLANSEPRSFQVRILPADPKDVVGQNTRFFSNIEPDRPTLDLAVEIVMDGVPDEVLEEVAARHVRDNAQLIWLVCPETRTVRVHCGGKRARELDVAATLDGDEVLQGFLCKVAELYG